MARLPQFVSEARLPATGGAAEIDRRFPLDSSGRALGTLADKAVDVAGTALVATVRAREEGEVTRAIADSTQKLDTLRIELDKDPDYLGREQKFNAAAKALEAETAGTLSPNAANAYRQRLAGLYASQAHSVRWQAVKDQNDALRVQLDADTDTILEGALGTRNKAERLAKLGALDDALKRAQETGVLSGAQYLQWKKAKLEKFDELTVSRVMRTAPGAALALLNDKGATPYLDPLRREQLKIQATARGEQMSALAKSDARAEVASAIDAFGRGNLAPSNLEAARTKARAFPELSKQLAHAEYVYGQTHDFATKSQAEQADLIAAMRRDEGRGSATPTDTALRDAYEKIFAATAKSYRQDPAATALQRNAPGAERLALAERAYADAPTPEARQDAGDRFRQALLDLQHFQQTDGGLAPVLTRLLPKATADMLETNFNKLAGQERLTFLEAQRTKYGSLWPEVLAQLDEGKKLPADVKILGAQPGAFRANQSAALVQQALAIPEKQRAELVPEEGVRKRIPALVGEAAQPLRETMRRTPGEIGAYADYADAIQRTAEFLLGTKRAPSPEAAVRQAYKIVVDDHWTMAGGVRIPKIEGRPVADPTMIAAYGEYLARNLDKYYLAVPEAVGPLAQVPELRRLQMWRDHLRAYGGITADRFENGVVLRDGEGRVVRGQNGQAISATWAEIANDKDFQRWREGAYRDEQMPRAPGLERDPALERLLPPTGAPPEKRGGGGGDDPDIKRAESQEPQDIVPAPNWRMSDTAPYPSEDDAKQAIRSGYGYGTPAEGLLSGQFSRVTQMKAVGLYEDEILDESTRTAIKKNKDVDEAAAIYLNRAALAADKIPLAQLGFDPTKIVLQRNAPRTTLGGVYSPRRDISWVNTAFTGLALHESVHRGIEELRRAGNATANGISHKDEEHVVRYIVDTWGGQIDRELISEKKMQESLDYVEAHPDLEEKIRLLMEAAAALSTKRAQSPRMGPR